MVFPTKTNMRKAILSLYICYPNSYKYIVYYLTMCMPCIKIHFLHMLLFSFLFFVTIELRILLVCKLMSGLSVTIITFVEFIE